MTRRKHKLPRSEARQILDPPRLFNDILVGSLLDHVPRFADQIEKIIEKSESIRTYEKPWYNAPQNLARFLYDNPASYRRGYKNAVDMISIGYSAYRAAEDETGSFHDHGIDYPILFLIRHWLEISIKDYIAYLRLAVRNGLAKCEAPIGSCSKTHNLIKISTGAVQASRSIDRYGLHASDCSALMSCSSELTSIDPTAAGFRYFNTTDDRRSIENGMVFDVMRIRENAAKICNVLDILCRHIEQEIRVKADACDGEGMVGVRMHPIPKESLKHVNGNRYMIFIDPIYA